MRPYRMSGWTCPQCREMWHYTRFSDGRRIYHRCGRCGYIEQVGSVFATSSSEIIVNTGNNIEVGQYAL